QPPQQFDRPPRFQAGQECHFASLRAATFRSHCPQLGPTSRPAFFSTGKGLAIWVAALPPATPDCKWLINLDATLAPTIEGHACYPSSPYRGEGSRGSLERGSHAGRVFTNQRHSSLAPGLGARSSQRPA